MRKSENEISKRIPILCVEYLQLQYMQLRFLTYLFIPFFKRGNSQKKNSTSHKSGRNIKIFGLAWARKTIFLSKEKQESRENKGCRQNWILSSDFIRLSVLSFLAENKVCLIVFIPTPPLTKDATSMMQADVLCCQKMQISAYCFQMFLFFKIFLD